MVIVLNKILLFIFTFLIIGDSFKKNTILKNNNITHIVMAGKIERPSNFDNITNEKANELIIMAKDLNIPVSADALQNCIELENNLSGLSSLLSRITSVILKNTDSKRSR